MGPSPGYGISEEENTSYLLDFVRGLPKAEVKALIKDMKTAEDILQFLQDSYSGVQNLGELQRLFLQRK